MIAEKVLHYLSLSILSFFMLEVRFYFFFPEIYLSTSWLVICSVLLAKLDKLSRPSLLILLEPNFAAILVLVESPAQGNLSQNILNVWIQ